MIAYSHPAVFMRMAVLVQGESMGDLLGAAASYLMIVLILMLMGQFIVQIGRMKRETLMGFGRVALYTGLFALAEYGLMMFFRRAATGAGKMITLGDIVDQRMFSHVFSQSFLDYSFCMALAALETAAAGCFFYQAVRAKTDARTTSKGIFWLLMLPGVEMSLLPFPGCTVLILCVVCFIFRKKLPFEKVRLPYAAKAVLMVLFAMMKTWIAYRLGMGA